MVAALGITTGFAGMIRGLKSIITLQKDFEKANAVLAGVLGKSRKETVKLQKDSLRLGQTTAFTAKQVVDLQIELEALTKSEGGEMYTSEDVLIALENHNKKDIDLTKISMQKYLTLQKKS